MNIIAFGFWLGLPITGELVSKLIGRKTIDALTQRRKTNRFIISTVLGISVWSLLLLVCMLLGIFNSQLLGLIGWILFFVAMIYSRKSTLSKKWWRTQINFKLDKIDVFLLFVLYFCRFFI